MTEFETPPAPAPRPPRRRAPLAAFGAIATAGLAVAAVLAAQGTGSAVLAQGAPARVQTQFHARGALGDDGVGGAGPDRTGSGDTGTTGATGSATAAQSVGVVDIVAAQQYQNAEAAGTGMLLTSDGEVLTNNHVVDGATRITVTVVSTGASYPATVVGTDPTDDVAVLQLQHASGLATVRTSSATVAVGDAVTAVGNAGGTGGTPSAAAGSVTALDRTITASDESGGNAEQLRGLIETDADVRAGDSGGPLYDSAGRVIGMDTAAAGSGAADGYAIPIATAVSIAGKIEAGVDDATVHQGYPAFLGVSVRDGDGGALVAGVAPGSAAGSAGLAAGDLITAVGGQAVGSADALSTVLRSDDPGRRVQLAWTDASGVARSATVTLGTGPAD